MCGRFVLEITPELLAEVFGVVDPPQLSRRYNIAPSQQIAVVRRLEGENRVAMLRWGLVPSWSKLFDAGQVNARSETASEKPYFRSALRHRRCIVPASGYYEWRKAGRKKYPYFIHVNETSMGIAGIWESWESPKGEIVETCCLLTTSANALTGTIHERMPVILPPSAYSLWLDDKVNSSSDLKHLFQPYPSDEMSMYPVAELVNSPHFDSPACILQVESAIDEPAP